MDRRYLLPIVLAFLLAPLLAHVGFALAPGAGSYAVVSGSMEPTFETGSLVYVVETDDYAVGDVVTFSRENTVVTHRIVGVTHAGFVTKGDANAAADPWRVAAEEIRGETVLSVPLYGRLLLAAQTPVGYVTLVLLPGTALVALELRRLRRLLADD